MAGDERTGRTRDRTEWVLVAAASIAFAVPLALSPYPPGGDTPWHAAVVAILAEDDAGRFLGAFEKEAGFGSYVAVYRALALLARAIGAAAAVQVLCVLYVIGTVWAARALARSFAADGALALLAAPAAYSTTLEYGFLIYLPTVPLTLWLWALVRSVMQGGARPGRVAALAAAWFAISLCHPFAAAVAGSGAALLWLCDLTAERRPRAAVVAGVMVVGALPAALALAAVPGGAGPRVAGMGGASLWDHVTHQIFVSPLESALRAPVGVLGFVDLAWRYGLVAVLAAVAVAWRMAAPAPALSGGSASRRAAAYLALLLAALYLVTPFTFEWPRNWYGAQPRLLPLVWAVGLVALRPGAARWPRGAGLIASATALLVLELQALLPYAREARDLAAVIARSPTAVRTLGLIEQRRAVDREPPDSFRNATGWLVSERGGIASHLPMADPAGLNSGQHIPVRLGRAAAQLPAAPPLGFARAFRWDRHAAGWDQFLIRDLEPARTHDYFAGRADEVQTIARSGRWRLVRRLE